MTKTCVSFWKDVLSNSDHIRYVDLTYILNDATSLTQVQAVANEPLVHACSSWFQYCIYQVIKMDCFFFSWTNSWSRFPSLSLPSHVSFKIHLFIVSLWRPSNNTWGFVASLKTNSQLYFAKRGLNQTQPRPFENTLKGPFFKRSFGIHKRARSLVIFDAACTGVDVTWLHLKMFIKGKGHRWRQSVEKEIQWSLLSQ